MQNKREFKLACQASFSEPSLGITNTALDLTLRSVVSSRSQPCLVSTGVLQGSSHCLEDDTQLYLYNHFLRPPSSLSEFKFWFSTNFLKSTLTKQKTCSNSTKSSLSRRRRIVFHFTSLLVVLDGALSFRSRIRNFSSGYATLITSLPFRHIPPPSLFTLVTSHLEYYH